VLEGSAFFSSLLHAIKTQEIASAIIVGLPIFFIKTILMLNEWWKRELTKGYNSIYKSNEILNIDKNLMQLVINEIKA